ncbi:glycosyltransferase family 2 protein [Kumtagia ephedrae]|uniref:Glycosyltransferase 2-like domain-containing protein n=1 Tax=Kumtagia ephedrae TaxID=2116701 RepID=A0A2P7S224_9HYPH|nr:glycosyltransferase family A protein [Mesorhizobium ephedrae]PSJ56510.1 hypothetical protein C7I84_20270 [Mesorhizobium ephedrae]
MELQEQLRHLRNSGQLHSKWYRDQYPDVGILGMDPAEHYLKYGARLGRNPGKNFDTRYYVERYPDVEDSGLNPVVHYVLHGQTQGRAYRVDTSDVDVVRRLYRKLWAGLGESAAVELEEIAQAEGYSNKARRVAAVTVATWLDYRGDSFKALGILLKAAYSSSHAGSSKDVQMRLGFLRLNFGDAKGAGASFAKIRQQQVDSDVYLALANVQDDDEARLAQINKTFHRNDLAEIRLRKTGEPLALSNIEGVPTPCAQADVGKVSVIMPAYSAARFIDVALRSLCKQTYQNLEIIVVDDCSPDDTYDVVCRLAASDSRIVPVRQERNQGAYPARNRGLEVASGDFITTHDADDWSHPQKIERQIGALVQNPDLMGVLTHWARVHHDLRFTTNWRLSDQVIHWSHSSFLFRRAVLDRLGGWDNVRVSADTEYIWRVENAFGEAAVKKLLRETPMAFALDDESSLTRTKLTHVSTTYYGLRHYYREICRYWHESVGGRLTPEQEEMKRRMIPRQMFTRDESAIVVDEHLLGDCSDPAVVRQMTAAARDGTMRYGITHVMDPKNDIEWPMYAQRFCDEFFELLAKENTAVIVPGAACEAAKTSNFT